MGWWLFLPRPGFLLPQMRGKKKPVFFQPKNKKYGKNELLALRAIGGTMI